MGRGVARVAGGFLYRCGGVDGETRIDGRLRAVLGFLSSASLSRPAIEGFFSLHCLSLRTRGPQSPGGWESAPSHAAPPASRGLARERPQKLRPCIAPRINASCIDDVPPKSSRRVSRRLRRVRRLARNFLDRGSEEKNKNIPVIGALEGSVTCAFSGVGRDVIETGCFDARRDAWERCSLRPFPSNPRERARRRPRDDADSKPHGD